MIDLRKTLLTASESLRNAGVSHALIGGFAMAIYGHHRATVDVDFLADGAKKELIKATLLKMGFNLKFESSEVLQFDGVGLLDILLANRPVSLEMLKEAKQNSQIGVYVLRPEDIIGLKIQAYKNDSTRMLKDQADIQMLLGSPTIDLKLVKRYADLFSEWPTIEKILELNR